ncbi:acetyltransferase (GNAT) family protein [Prauserella shujinwangii]|uniref:Acetyltransferase (GNAT) family protein n=1 Tax=Prauserella shujinwangii TaxID=1453103 RepID=A0A2T0LVH7_9PSEU|nr:GNAT family N-acetyltransferase [Prauserella shujinwangii]PRX47807.1 acetyltransferase (GNAT) family protein [Prauserella shujinwangii]
MDIDVRTEEWDSADGERLRAAQRAELDARYGSDDHEPGARPSAGDIAVFLVARDGTGRAVGCGALRLLGPETAEIKRMYVVPDARGSGVAVAVLRELERHAWRLGVRTVKLETGPAQPDAIRFYEREGYRAIDNFGPYRGEPLSRCFARDLTPQPS